MKDAMLYIVPQIMKIDGMCIGRFSTIPTEIVIENSITIFTGWHNLMILSGVNLLKKGRFRMNMQKKHSHNNLQEAQGSNSVELHFRKR